MRAIHISVEDKTPIYLQIARDIKRMIATGELKEGDRLPGRQALAGELGVNVNTINYTFRVLENEGFIHSKRGVGSFARRKSENNRMDLLREIGDQLRAIKQKAFNYGVSPEDFSRLVEESLFPERRNPRPTAVFIECHEAWTNSGADELEQALGIEVDRVVIPDGEKLVREMREKLTASDIVLTTHPHFNEIRAMLGPDRFIFPLDQHSSYEMVTTLAAMRDSRIAVPFLKPSAAKRLGLSLRAAGCLVNLVSIKHKGPDDLAKKIRGYKVLLLPPNHIADVKALAADDVTIVPIRAVLGDESIQSLKERLSGMYAWFKAW